MERIAILNTFYTSAKSRARLPVHPALLEDASGLILVDCGGSLRELESQAKENGLDPKKLVRIIITHHDQDHIGCLADLKEVCPGAAVVASRTEAEYISGKKEFERLRQARALQASLPAGRKAEADALIGFYTAIKKTEVDEPVDPPVTFPWCGGLTILSTPGHMPGHISVYLEKSKTLIAGDALAIENGRLLIDGPHTLDMKMARASARRFLDLDIARLICYHGGVLETHIRESIKEALGE